MVDGCKGEREEGKKRRKKRRKEEERVGDLTGSIWIAGQVSFGRMILIPDRSLLKEKKRNLSDQVYGKGLNRDFFWFLPAPFIYAALRVAIFFGQPKGEKIFLLP